MEPAKEADTQFLQAAQRIGVIGVKQVEKLLELARESGKPAREIAEKNQMMTAGQIARVLQSLGEAPPPEIKRTFAPAPAPVHTSAPPSSSGWKLGPIIGVAVIAVLAFLGGILFTGSSDPMKAGGQNPTPHAGKTEAEIREMEASALLSEAETSLAAGKFDAALALYDRVEREYPSTVAVVSSAEKARAARERCRAELARAAPTPSPAPTPDPTPAPDPVPAPPAPLSEAERRLLEKWTRVNELVSEGRWPEAEPLLKELTREMAPDDARRAQVAAWIGRLTLDPGVIAAWDRVKELANLEDWPRVYNEVRAFSAAHSGAANFEKIGPEVQALLERAYAEMLAVEQLEAAREARSRGDWNALVAALDDLRRARASTKTYAAAKGEIDKLAAEALERASGPAPAAAREIYNHARSLEMGGKLEEAQLAYHRLLTEMASSPWVSERRGEIEAALARVKAARAPAAEAEAQHHFAEIQRLVKAKQWKQALEAIGRFEALGSATKLRASKQAEIHKMTTDCQRELALILSLMVDDLEYGAERWEAFTGGVRVARSKKGEDGGDAFEGTNSVVLEYAAHTRGARAAWPRATCRLNRVVPPKSTRVTFSARSEGGGSSLIVDFTMRLGFEEAVLTSSPVPIGAAWSRVAVPLSDFRFEWKSVNRGEHQGMKITLRTEDLQALGFTSNTPDRRIKVWIDDVRFE